MSVTLDLDGTGKCEANTGIPFLDHMLDVRPCVPWSQAVLAWLNYFCHCLCCGHALPQRLLQPWV